MGGGSRLSSGSILSRSWPMIARVRAWMITAVFCSEGSKEGRLMSERSMTSVSGRAMLKLMLSISRVEIVLVTRLLSEDRVVWVFKGGCERMVCEEGGVGAGDFPGGITAVVAVEDKVSTAPSAA